MLPKRPKKAYAPSIDAMERRQLLSNAPLGAMARRAAQPIEAEVARRRDAIPADAPDARPRFEAIAAEVARRRREAIPADAPDARPRFLSGQATLRASRPGSRGGVVTVEQQASIADTFLRLADPVLGALAKYGDGAQPAATQVRQRLSQLSDQAVAQPSALVSATQDDLLGSLLDTFGPGDPFASLGVVSTDSLKPGDIILRCTDSLGSQAIELAHWSRYSHVALYIGDGQIIDAMPNGVHTRPLSEMLSDSNRASVLRVPDLSPAQAQAAIRAAKAQEGAAYNFTGLVALEVQKAAAVIAHAGEGLGGIIGVLSRAERLPSSLIDNGTFACSQLVRYAFLKAGISLTQANGAAPGDFVRLGMAGVLDEVGRLEVPAKVSTAAATGAWLP